MLAVMHGFSVYRYLYGNTLSKEHAEKPIGIYMLLCHVWEINKNLDM
jgi:hypothetical protein